MCTIIKIECTEQFHEIESQSHRTENWMGPEWVEVPEALVGKLNGGYCDLVIFDGVLTDVVPTEMPPAPEPEPTADELMDILLGVENDG